jgi:purine nucleoside permease
MTRRLTLCILLLLCGFAAPAHADPIKVKVVVVAMFEVGKDTGDVPGEFQFWVEREKLERTWAFPQGERDLRSTPDGSVLGVDRCRHDPQLGDHHGARP